MPSEPLKGLSMGLTWFHILLNNYCGRSVESKLGSHSELYARVGMVVAWIREVMVEMGSKGGT